MATLDFTELTDKPQGEAFEALVRQIGERLGMVVEWSGRGADGGRDLVFIERQSGPLGQRTFRWLVSCKDHSSSGTSVSEREVGSVTDKLAQHRCDGSLLATTTTASTGLKELLDRLSDAPERKVATKVWDRFEITRILSEDRFADLLRQFFPRQAAKADVLKIDAAREVIETALPRVAVGTVRQHLVPRAERLAQLDGARVCPGDPEQAGIIDRLKLRAVQRDARHDAVDWLMKLQFEPFLAFMDAMIRNFPVDARRLLTAAAKESYDGGFLFNAIEILNEFDGFTPSEEHELAQRCDPDTLHEMYRDTVSDYLSNTRLVKDYLPEEIRAFDDEVSIEDVALKEIEFEAVDGIVFRAAVELDVLGYSFDAERGPEGRATFGCMVQGYLVEDDIQIDKMYQY